MIYKLIQWFKRNSCKECDYYCVENNVCQSKKCATCGCHPYVNWFDRHFCEAYKAESEEEWCEKVAEQAIDVYIINGRTIREWIEILSDELTMLDKIRAEIENDWQLKKYPSSPFSCGLRRAIEIIDKHKDRK